MALTKLNNALILLDKFNFTGQSNSLSLEYSADTPEATVFGNDTHNMAATLLSMKGSVQGFWDSALAPTQLPDPNMFSMIGSAAIPITFGVDNTDGAVAYMFNGRQTGYNFFGKVGDLAPFSLSCEASVDANAAGGFVTKGVLGLPMTSRTASATGTGYELGALTSAQKLIASLHVVAFTGTSLAVIVESDDNVNFTSPTTRITFTSASGLTSEWKELAGPITDTYFRVKATFVGTSFSAAVACGVQSIV